MSAYNHPVRLPARPQHSAERSARRAPNFSEGPHHATVHTRRRFIQQGVAATSFGLLSPRSLPGATANPVPQSVNELWADFDPRRDPIEAEVIREWRETGGVFRHVRFLVGIFKGRPARMTTIYGYPDGAREKLPAVMHIHGGGQRAFLHEVKFLVARGYAALSVNWGGTAGNKAPFNFVEGAQPGDPNTDWGAVDPSQLNVPGYQTLQPGPKQFFEDRAHPKNNNWYLLTLGCRRALTFLEQQPEVDPQRLGVHGWSMGGNLTMYVAGCDDRVKVAVPGVGGSGWRSRAHEFVEGTAPPPMRIQGDAELFSRTLGFESYAPLIRCPVLHRSGTNDFHGWMDDVYRTNALIRDRPTRYCFSPHLNHRALPEAAVGMPLWLDHFLKDGPALPETPASELILRTSDSVPNLRVMAHDRWPAVCCEIYYSVDDDPRARFWRSTDVTRQGNTFTAKLPLHALDRPLFAFANVYHALPEPVSLAALPGFKEPVRELGLSSLLHSEMPAALRAAGVRATLQPGLPIDDFAGGLRDWYQLNAGNLPRLQTWTRKLTDPLYRGAEGARLKLTLRMPRTNQLDFVAIENEWRSYRGVKRTFVCTREISGAAGEQSVILAPADFRSSGGPLNSWRNVDQFAICAFYAERGETASRTPGWDGPAATFVRLEWI